MDTLVPGRLTGIMLRIHPFFKLAGKASEKLVNAHAWRVIGPAELPHEPNQPARSSSAFALCTSLERTGPWTPIEAVGGLDYRSCTEHFLLPCKLFKNFRLLGDGQFKHNPCGRSVVNHRHPTHAQDVTTPQPVPEFERIAIDLFHVTLAVRAERREHINVDE